MEHLIRQGVRGRNQSSDLEREPRVGNKAGWQIGLKQGVGGAVGEGVGLICGTSAKKIGFYCLKIIIPLSPHCVLIQEKTESVLRYVFSWIIIHEYGHLMENNIHLYSGP